MVVHLLPHQLPWWLAGPVLGSCVTATYGLLNRKLGVSGGWLQLILVARGRPAAEPWRLWFNGGLVGGAVLAGVLGAGSALHGYGRLSAVLSVPVLVPVLVLVGLAVGYGARWAGGCTSGHGLSGCSVRSPESFAATVTFFAVAVGVTLLVHVLSGGAV